MAFTWVLPPLGGGSTATIEHWYHAAGKTVVAHEPLVLVRTEQAVYVLPVPVAGELTTLLVDVGNTLAVGGALAEIATGEAEPVPASTPPRVRSTPLARRMAALHHIALDAIVGSGRGGRIIRADILRHGSFTTGGEGASPQSAPPAASVPVASPAPLDVLLSSPATVGPLAEPPAGGRKEQAGTALLSATSVASPVSLDAPQAISVMEVMLDRALAVCQREAARRHREVRITPALCVAYAAGMELPRHRLLNAGWMEDEIVLWGRVHLGVVHDGQQAVIRDAPEHSLVGLARSVQERDTGGNSTFSILSSDGRWSEAPLLPGHAATLTVGTPAKQAVVVTGPRGDRVEIRVVAQLALCYDARVLAQHEVDAFLLAVKRRVEALP